MKKFILLVLVILAAFQIVGCNQEEINTEVPLMWRTTSESGNTIYILGSIHYANNSIQPLPQFILEAFRRSDYLALEGNMFNQSSHDQNVMRDALMLPDGTNVKDLITPELYETARGMIIEKGLLDGFIFREYQLDNLSPIVWASMLDMYALDKAGMEHAYGIDSIFNMIARTSRMPIIELDSVYNAAGVYSFSAPILEMILQSAIDIENNVQYFRDTLDVWARGDEETMLSTFFEHEDSIRHLMDEYLETALFYRSAYMGRNVLRLLEQDKNVFVVVGTAHTIGDRSIVAKLEANGFEVERIFQ